MSPSIPTIHIDRNKSADAYLNHSAWELVCTFGGDLMDSQINVARELGADVLAQREEDRYWLAFRRTAETVVGAQVLDRQMETTLTNGYEAHTAALKATYQAKIDELSAGLYARLNAALDDADTARAALQTALNDADHLRCDNEKMRCRQGQDGAFIATLRTELDASRADRKLLVAALGTARQEVRDERVRLDAMSEARDTLQAVAAVLETERDDARSALAERERQAIAYELDALNHAAAATALRALVLKVASGMRYADHGEPRIGFELAQEVQVTAAQLRTAEGEA